MPAINPHSEYKKKFRWHDSVKSASFTPTKQQSSVTAGLSSFDSAKAFSKIEEPAMQHKKRPLIDPHKTYITHILPEALTDQPDALRPAPVKSALRKTNPKDKKPKKNSGVNMNNNATRVIHSKEDKENDFQSASDQETKHELKEQDFANKSHLTNSEKDKNKANRAMQFQAGIRAPKSGGPKYNTEYQRQFAWKKPIIKESPLIAAEQMVYSSNTNIAPYVPDKIPRNSEYQNQFKPLKIRSPPQGHKEKLQKIAEQEIKAKYKLRNKKKKKRLSPEKMAAAGVPSTIIHEDPSLLRRVQNPQAPFFPHATKKWKSEYNSNFKAPSKFNYTHGVWKGADPPQIQPRDDASDKGEGDKKDKESYPNWFNEVAELRERAKAYKKRARGTHFSREHLAQLLAEQAKLWDRTENGDEDADDKTQKNAKNQAVVAAGKPSRKDDVKLHVPTRKEEDDDQSPVRRRLAWTEKNDKNLNNNNDNESSIGSIPTPERLRDSVSSSSNLEILDENGRVPTPELPDKGIKQRHHFDRTTPYTGGALLTSPQPSRKVSGSSPLHRSSDADEPVYRPSNREYAINKSPSKYQERRKPGLTYNVDKRGSSDEYDEDDDSTPVKATTFHLKSTKPVAGSPTAGVRSQDPDPLNDDLSEHSFNRHSNNFFETSPAVKYIPGTGSPPRTWAAPRPNKDQARPTANGGPLNQPRTNTMHGRPQTARPMTRKQAQTESLPSDDASTVSSAKVAREKLAAKSRKPTALKTWTVPTKDDLHLSLGVSKLDDSPTSDQMSMSALSSVSSCSLASDILDRARKRRDKFWGK